MKINEKLSGFILNESRDIDSIGATMHLFEHESTGAKLCYLEREDESRTFAISFRTPPTDDTGVFHILEHSVLCGSEKFPVKEPFTELLKGSLNTFLNAITYSDRTAYPVSSRSDKDFYNLVDVYMDAVFNPEAVKDERIFRQEGWRYEVGEDGEIGYNGVVYSEMKGVYSSADAIADYHNARLLFPGGTYSYDSGGHPSAIPELEYSDFVAAHERYYHPSGAYIFLDGEVKLDEIFPLLDSYLSVYERREMRAEVVRGGEVITEPLHERYEIDPGESGEDKTRVCLNYITAGYDDKLAGITLSALTDALADSNEAPLKKAILSANLCDNVYIYNSPAGMWGTLCVEFKGVRDGKTEELIAHFDACCCEMLGGGIDRALLSASCDRLEFKTREADFGSTPKGIVYLSAISDMWLYGAHPADALDHDKGFKALRDAIATDYPEKLLSSILGGPRSTLILTPSATLAEERERELNERIASYTSTLNDAQKAELRERSLLFTEWQERDDTPEALATIPTLTLADIGDEEANVTTIVSKYGVSQLLEHDISTNGIAYTQMCFDASDLDEEEIFAASVMFMLYPNLDTKTGSASDFRRRSKSTLGGIDVLITPIKKGDEVRLYIALSYSCLDTKRMEAAELGREYLLDSILENRAALRRTLVQKKALYSDIITDSGHSIAATRAAASFSVMDALKEYSQGYEFYKRLKRAATATDAELDALIAKMARIRERVFTKARLTAAVTGKPDSEAVRAFIDTLPDGEPTQPTEIRTMPVQRVGIAIPSQVSYAVSAAGLACSEQDKNDGAWNVLSTILDFEVLWEEIRVKGGAYGCGFTQKPNSGVAVLYSYRDPSPEKSLNAFSEIGSLLSERLADSLDLEKLIIGTIGSCEPIKTPSTTGSRESVLFLSGKTHEDVIKRRRDCIATTKERLLELSEILGTTIKIPSSCIVGPREELLKLGLDEILEI